MLFRSTYPCLKELHQKVRDLNNNQIKTQIVSAKPWKSNKSKKILEKLLGDVDVDIHEGKILSSIFALPGLRYIEKYKKIANKKIYIIKKAISIIKEKHNNPVLIFWIGDNGQGDERVAKVLLDEGLIDDAFIHKVDQKKEIFDNRINYFCTYKDVIKYLYKIGRAHV